MSYARLDGKTSDVYVWSDGNRLHCTWCRLSTTGDEALFTDYPEMLAHLAEHSAQGHRVPDYALEALRREAAVSPSVAEVSRLEDEGLVGLF
jgi:hypothetical protein